ncbi:MAG: glyoxalase/bleomycin resistance/extradiol dioxygenase family protein [Ahrensia sp.]|nr:glyoxalase/bleomycin resistance/extradiol dioxygenase family protein [Ahrensia sp.]
MAHMTRITRFALTADLDAEISFFTDILSFECSYRADNYAFVRRDAVALRLIEVGPQIDLADERRQNSCYIDVEGIDALYAELKPKLDMLPPGRVRAPFDQDYGQREFHVIDEGAMLIFFGEPVRA